LKRKKTSERVAEENENDSSKTPETKADDIKPTNSNSAEVIGSPPITNSLESREESFTTGPHGIPTHWKQAVFLLKAPIEIQPGRSPPFSFFDKTRLIQIA
jgi:hypothetical protein